MDQLINKVLEIDKIAQKKVKLAKEENDKFLEKVNDRKQEIIKEIQDMADKKLHEMEKQELKFAEEEISKLEKRQKDDINKLQYIYDENSKKWVTDIVARTLSN